MRHGVWCASGLWCGTRFLWLRETFLVIEVVEPVVGGIVLFSPVIVDVFVVGVLDIELVRVLVMRVGAVVVVSEDDVGVGFGEVVGADSWGGVDDGDVGLAWGLDDEVRVGDFFDALGGGELVFVGGVGNDVIVFKWAGV